MIIVRAKFIEAGSLIQSMGVLPTEGTKEGREEVVRRVVNRSWRVVERVNRSYMVNDMNQEARS